MRLKSYLWLAPATALVMTAIPCDASQSLPTEVASATPRSAVTGSSLLRSMVDAAAGLNEYSFDCQITTYRESGKVNEAGRFYFKKPRQVRVEVTAGGKKGAVVVLRQDGKVRGHLGGLLKFFVGTLSKDSHWVRSSNGYSILDADYKSLAEALIDFQSQGWQSRVTRKENQPDCEQRNYVLEMTSPDKHLSKTVIIDETTLLPVEWRNYTGGKPSSIARWSNLKTNAGLPDKLFKL